MAKQDSFLPSQILIDGWKKIENEKQMLLKHYF